MANLYCSPIADNLEKADCGFRRGGVNTIIYAANLGDIAEISSTLNDKEMDTITMNINPITTQPYFWYQLAFKKNTAGGSNEGVFGNNKYMNQTLTLGVEGITKQSLAVLETMADGEIVFIVKDFENKYHVFGRIGGLEMSALTYGTGTAADDMYGGTITFTSAEPELSNLVKAGTQIKVWDGTAAVTVTL